MEKTPRGFNYLQFADGNGIACSIQESSACREETGMLWLGCDEPNAQVFPGDNTGWHPYPLPENVSCTTRMHLTQDNVRMLLPLLQVFAETGQLPEPAPTPSGETP